MSLFYVDFYFETLVDVLGRRSPENTDNSEYYRSAITDLFWPELDGLDSNDISTELRHFVYSERAI